MLIKVATGVWEVCWMQGGFVIRPTAEVSDFIFWSAALPPAYKDIAAASIQQACIYSAALWHCPESCYRAFSWWNVVITGLKPLQPIDYSEFEPTLMRCLTKSYLTNVFGSFQRSSPTSFWLKERSKFICRNATLLETGTSRKLSFILALFLRTFDCPWTCF